ncbi:HD domain-containing protein [Rhodobacterales bacterium]|nr:HD domain-containing protein [Rhodobacterales bacterium]
MEIVLISDGPLPLESPVRKLPFFFSCRLIDMSSVTPRIVGDARVAVIELQGTTDAGLRALRGAWESISSIPVLCIVTKSNRQENIQAAALGKTVVIDREISLALLLDRIKKLAGAATSIPVDEGVPKQSAQAFRKCNAFLESICLSAVQNSKIHTAEMRTGAMELFSALQIDGLSDWLKAVHSHHSATYRHSLTVAGYAGAFAEHLGWSEADCQEVIAGGLIHDIGKMRIPLTILDKAEKLTDKERAAVKRHPDFARDILKARLEVPIEIKKMAIQHHEYLDGSGYPNGLKADRISTKVRLITVCDIYVALTEDRAYRPGLSSRDAIVTLKDMSTKLDQGLVLEFGRMLLNRDLGDVSRKSSAA